MQRDFMTKIFNAKASMGDITHIEVPRETMQMVMGPSFNEPSFHYQNIEVFEEGTSEKEISVREQSVLATNFPKG